MTHTKRVQSATILVRCTSGPPAFLQRKVVVSNTYSKNERVNTYTDGRRKPLRLLHPAVLSPLDGSLRNPQLPGNQHEGTAERSSGLTHTQLPKQADLPSGKMQLLNAKLLSIADCDRRFVDVTGYNCVMLALEVSGCRR